MKTILTAITLQIGVTCFAQVTPQYYIDEHPNGIVAPIVGWNSSSDTSVLQTLLPLDSFSTARPPYGKIKNIYIRTGANGHWNNCKSTKVKLSLGSSNLINFDTVTRHVMGLTLLTIVDTLTTDTVKGAWIKIPIRPEISYYIDTTKNLVFERTFDTGGIARLPQGSPGSCSYLGSFNHLGGSSIDTKTFSLKSTKSNYKNVVIDNWFFDFGFDLYPNPASIAATQNVTDLRIYPNPSKGRFIISMAATRVVKDARLSVSDMAGRVVWQQQYQNIDENFYRNIDISAYPQGIYLAELRADRWGKAYEEAGSAVIRKGNIQ